MYPLPFYSTVGAGGVPVAFNAPNSMFGPPAPYPGPAPAPGFSPAWNGYGLAGPLPAVPRPAAAPNPQPAVQQKKAGDEARAKQYVTFGDRLFRAGNYRKAEERYEQAARTDPHSAIPRARLAQIALVRGQYHEAANHLREAQTAEPGWLTKPFDIQSLYAEPGDFARQVAKLESHLQAEPQDRDGWLVLGAQWYLSGRTEKASDVFLRLTDRKPDATLAAFLDAATPVDRAGQ
ncbi:tetratricopeptide repeat protein [Singulisphaera sp. PoT]|uniref:tetratricopeptide repeat protein n=1 Tax=Singulisphaera sp. PoT TaxID=3411797 RepID=UPI003BF5B3E0